MLKLELQNFLIENSKTHRDPLSLLKEQYGISAKQHTQYHNLFQFSYDQIQSAPHKFEQIVIESRGIILNSLKGWAVVARPFDRFFNYGEAPQLQAKFDWSNIRAEEKLDGSLMILYHYDFMWRVATKGSPNAGGNCGNFNITFSELFWDTFHNQYGNEAETWEPIIPDEFIEYTFMFELTSKFNRVVTSQQENNGKLTLIGIRHNETGVEISTAAVKYERIKQFNLSNINQIIAASKELDPNKQEGFVIVDSNYNRIKVKSDKYVLIHHLKESVNDVRLIGLVKSGEESEVFIYFPDIKTRFDELKMKFETLDIVLDSIYNEKVNGVSFNSQKDFALFVQDNFVQKYHSYFYARHSGRVNNANEWLISKNDSSLVELLTK